MEDLIKHKLQQSPLFLTGWEEETLLSSVAYDLEPLDIQGRVRCMMCHAYIGRQAAREFCWEKVLKRIEQCQNPNAEGEQGLGILAECERACRYAMNREMNFATQNRCSFETGDDTYHSERMSLNLSHQSHQSA